MLRRSDFIDLGILIAHSRPMEEALTMCGRFSLTTPGQELLETWGASSGKDFVPRYNVAPTQDILILRITPDGQKQLAPVRWGLIPAWAEALPTGAPLINARCETVTSKPSFRSAFRSRRCLVPGTGFYEWLKEGRKRLPFHITYRDGRQMFFAGIWDRWQNPQRPEQVIDSCAIITTAACPAVEPLHNRMPLLIEYDYCDCWLHSDPDTASSLLAPYSGHDLVLTPANPKMNSGATEGPECLQSPQAELF